MYHWACYPTFSTPPPITENRTPTTHLVPLFRANKLHEVSLPNHLQMNLKLFTRYSKERASAFLKPSDVHQLLTIILYNHCRYDLRFRSIRLQTSAHRKMFKGNIKQVTLSTFVLQKICRSSIKHRWASCSLLHIRWNLNLRSWVATFIACLSSPLPVQITSIRWDHFALIFCYFESNHSTPD